MPTAVPSTNTVAPDGSLSTASWPTAGAGVVASDGEGVFFASPLAATAAWMPDRLELV